MGHAPHSKVSKIAEKKRKRNLQKLNELKLLPKEKNLSKDQKTVPDDKPVSQREEEKTAA